MGTAPPAGRASAAGPFATIARLAVCVAPPAHVREYSGKSRLAQHPTRRCAAVRGETRPQCARRYRRALESNGRRGTPRVHLGHCSNARDARRAGPAVCHAHCAGGLLGCLGGHAGLLARPATTLAWHRHVCKHWRAEAPADRPFARLTPLRTFLSTSCAAPGAREAGPGDWPHGWQFHASRTRSLYFRDRVLLPTLEPAQQALLLSQSGPQAAAWLTAIPADRSTSLPPEVMQIALRRRLRLPLPLGPRICGQHGHGCRRRLDPWGDHALACTRSGLLARRAKLVEQAWLAVCREAVGAEGHVVPQQWLSHTSAPGVPTSDRRRLDLVVYGASPQGLALCCDATLVSPITGASAPHPRADHTPGIALRMAESRKRATYPELQRGGGQRLFVLAVEVGGRWKDDSQALVRQLVRVRALRAPPALRAAASSAWTRRWWGMLSTAVQHAVGGTALGAPVSKGAAGCEPALDHVLALAEPAGPSRLPLR